MAPATRKCNNSSTLADRLKALMGERSLTQKKVAEAAGVSRAAVAKWLQGTSPGAGELFKIARAFDKPMEWFFAAIPETQANAEDQAHVLSSPEDLRADKLKAAAASIGLATAKDFERLIDLSVNYRQVLTSHPDGTITMHYETVRPAVAEPPQKSSTLVLTTVSERVILPPMKSELQELLGAARRLTKSRGMKTRLAKDLGVPLPRVSDWLAGNYLPSGKRALQLREWVHHAQEVQQNQSPGSATTPPGRKTQSKASNEKKPKSSP